MKLRRRITTRGRDVLIRQLTPCLPPWENSFNVHSQQLSPNSLASFLERPKLRSAPSFLPNRCFENLLSGEICTKLKLHDSFDSLSRIFLPVPPHSKSHATVVDMQIYSYEFIRCPPRIKLACRSIPVCTQMPRKLIIQTLTFKAVPRTIPHDQGAGQRPMPVMPWPIHGAHMLKIVQFHSFYLPWAFSQRSYSLASQHSPKTPPFTRSAVSCFF